MNILILNSSSERNLQLEIYLQKFQLTFHKLGHYVKSVQIRELKFASDPSPVQGNTDDINYILNGLDETDLLLFASPVVNNHYSGLTSKIQNRIIEYYQYKAESHRKNRITGNLHIPNFGMILSPDNQQQPRDLLLIKLNQERIAANLHTLFTVFVTTGEKFTEAVSQTLRTFSFQLNAQHEILI